MREKYKGISSWQLPRNGKPHAQVRSLVELSLEVGISHRQLGGFFLHDDSSPKPTLRTGAKSRRATYYDYNEFKKWWAKRQNDKPIG